MIAIRLSRIGKKNKSEYRLIVQEKEKAPSSCFIEQVGFYNPHTNPPKIELNEHRIKYWLSQGAKASPTVFNILVNNKIADGSKIPLGRPRKKKENKEKEEKNNKPEMIQKKDDKLIKEKDKIKADGVDN